MRYPWHRDVPAEVAEITFGDEELLTLEKWPSEVFRPHFHESFNWIVPLRPGRVLVRVEEREIALTGDQWLCIFPRTRHTIVHVSDEVEVVGLLIPEPQMHAAYRRLKRKPPLQCPYLLNGKGIIAQGLALQWAEYRFSPPSDAALYRFFQLFVCGWLWEHYLPCGPEKALVEVRLKKSLGPVGEKASEFLLEHLAESPFPWQELTDQLHISQRTFQRLILKHLAVSPSQLLAEFRLGTAIELLHDPAERIVDIAFKCGFSSQAHFSTVFRGSTGKSPRQYRNQISVLSPV